MAHDRPRSRAWQRIATSLLAPVLFLAFSEVALRLIGFGGSHPLFVPSEAMPGYLRANPEVLRRYFPTRIPKIGPARIDFLEEKGPETYRIVVQGGSTAAGFPYGRWGGLAGMLGDRLEATFLERRVEVISTAVAAVNSYALLDFVDEVIEIEPDAVLIYAGHNEYLGIFGVGSALTVQRSRAATLLYLQLRRFRVHQLLQRLVSALRDWRVGSDADTGTDARRSLMARAAAGSEIAFRSEAFEQGLHQLEANLGAILEKYQRAGIPVYVGTLASNEKDQPPFWSSRRVSDQIDPEAWRAHHPAAGTGDVATARTALSDLLELDDDNADAWFALGRLEQEAGDPRIARDSYHKAKDRDRLRFRAPESFNQVIRRLASRYGAHLVDVQRKLAEASRDGIIGSELLLEHVHPNAEGYFLLADAYYQALERTGAIGDWSQARSRARAERDMPITALDRVLAEQAVRELRADFPFRETRQPVGFPEPQNEVERLAMLYDRHEQTWLETMESLLQLYRKAGRYEEAVVVARLAAQVYPLQAGPSFATGMLFLELGEFARARQYLDRSLAAKPDDPATLRASVRADLGLDDENRASEHLDRLRRIEPADPFVRRVERRLRRVRGRSAPKS